MLAKGKQKLAIQPQHRAAALEASQLLARTPQSRPMAYVSYGERVLRTMWPSCRPVEAPGKHPMRVFASGYTTCMYCLCLLNENPWHAGLG